MRAPPILVQCVDCHGGNPAVSLPAGARARSRLQKKTQKAAHVLPPSRTGGRPGKSRGEQPLEPREPRIRPLRQPRRPARGPETCGTEKCHPDEVRSSNLMMRTARCSGARPSTTTALSLQGRGLRRVLPPTESRRWRDPDPRRRQRRRAKRASCRGSSRCRAGRSPSPATCCGPSSAAAGRPLRDRQPASASRRARRTTSFPAGDSARSFAPIPSSSACRRRACSIRRSTSWAPTTIPATIARPAAPPATWSTPTTATRRTPGRTRLRPPRAERDGRSDDPAGTSGHPIKHALTLAIPSSQCVVCHMHPGTNVVNTYYGTMWWDNETDGKRSLYPAKSLKRSASEIDEIERHNPEGSARGASGAIRGSWSRSRRSTRS